MESPLMESSIKGAKGVILNITGGQDIGIFEVEEAAEHLKSQIDPDANIIWGFVQDDKMSKDSQEEIQVVVIATGFDLDGGAAQGEVKEYSPPVQQRAVESESFFSVDSPLDTPSYLRRKQR